MDHQVELDFLEIKKELEADLGCELDVQGILFLIGVNELGIGYKDFSKDEKNDLLHIAICTILEPHGFYEFIGRDEENWPHFELKKELPPLDHMQQQHLLKDAIISYFRQNEYVSNDEATS